VSCSEKPRTKLGGTERPSRCSGKMMSDFSKEQGRRAQSSRSGCGQEERFTLKQIISWLAVGPFLGLSSFGLKVEGFL